MAVTLLHLVVAGLLGAGVFGALIAAEPASALVALAWLVAGAAVYVAVFHIGRDDDRRRQIACALIGIGAIAGACVALQYRHLGYPEKVGIATALGRITSAIVPALGIPMPFPNSLATGLEGLLPLAFGLMGARRSSALERTFARAAGLLIAIGLLLSASRGAWIAEGVAFGLWAFFNYANSEPRRLAAGSAALATTLGVVTLWTLFVGPQFATAHPPASQVVSELERADRLDLYRHSLSLVRDFPFTGIGLGDQFAMALSQHALLIQVPFLTYPHNLFLDQWLERGLPGALVWVAFIAIAIVCCAIGERDGLGRGFRGASLGVIATIVHGLSDARQAVDGWTWLPLFALLGLMAVRLRQARIEITQPQAIGIGLAPAALTLVTLLGIWPIDAAWYANIGGLSELRAHALEASAARDLAMTEAEAIYRRAVDLDDRQPTAQRRLGILAMADGRYREAVAHLQIASEEAPDNWTTRKALGLACTWTGDIDRAVRLLGSLDDPQLAGELLAWSRWRASRGESELARRAAAVSAGLQAQTAPRAGVVQTLPTVPRS